MNNLGNALAGFENVPPMRGLWSWMVNKIEATKDMYYPMTEPTGQATAKMGNAMAWFVESVISPNTE